MARILIVDDEETDLLILQAILEGAGHEVYYARDGDEALAEFEREDIELVITDLHMPEVHGLELISKLRDKVPRPGIIAVSGTGEDQLMIAEALGAQHTIAKPVFPDKLLSTVDEVLASRD